MKFFNLCLILEMITLLSTSFLIILPIEVSYSQQWNIESSRATETIPEMHCESSETPYEEGNGYDEEALAWSNMDDMISKWGQPSGESHETFLNDGSQWLSDVVIAIVDTGITRDMWNAIEAQTACDIEVYVHWDYDSSGDPFLDLTTTDPDDVAAVGPPDDPPYVEYDQRSAHGSQIAWLVSQAANGSKLWILDFQGSDSYIYTKDAFILALQWLYSHRPDYSGLDIISVSSTNADDDSNEEQWLQRLQEEGIMIFAASGNAYGDENEDVILYPRSYEVVWGVGAHYDDPDNTLTDSQSFDEDAYRVSKSRCEDVRDSYYYWDSQYKSNPQPGESVEFMAPGFDYETRDKDAETSIVDDGTSYACPHAASIAAYAVATCNYAYTYSQSEIWSVTYDALKKAAEKSQVDDRVGLMGIGSEYPSSPQADAKIGYGSIDAYDTVRYLLGANIVSAYTSVSDGYYWYWDNPYASKSTTKVDIYRTGDYILRANYRVNGGSWLTNDAPQTFCSVGLHDVPSRWLADTNPNDYIEVWWSVLSPAPIRTLNAEDSIEGHFIDGYILDGSCIYYTYTKVYAIMHFEIPIAGTYYIKIRYQINGGSWVTDQYYYQYFQYPGTFYDDEYLYSRPTACHTVKVEWSIYDVSEVELEVMTEVTWIPSKGGYTP